MVSLSVFASALALAAVAAGAGPFAYHDHPSAFRTVQHRRHHVRHIPVPAGLEGMRERSPAAAAIAAEPPCPRDSNTCELGAWRCQGSELQRCFNDQWNLIQVCQGDNIICSSDPIATGCVWTWSIPASSSGDGDSSNDGSGGGTPSQPQASAAAPASHVSPSSSSTPSPSPTFPVLAPGPPPASSSSSSTPFGDDNGGGDDDCEDEDGDDSDDDDDLPYCDDDEDDGSTSASAVSTSAPSSSVIGGNLGAGAISANATANISSSSTGRGGRHSSLSESSKSKSSSSATATVTATGSKVSTISLSSSSTKRGRPTSSSASLISASSLGSISASASASASASVSASVSVSVASSSASTTPGSGGSSSALWTAPHYVIYSDYWLYTMPAAEDLAGYNRFILAFWMSDRGAVDNAQLWEIFDENYRKAIVQTYHEAGIALMVSAFGSTDSPTINGVDPTSCAQDLAAWVKKYNLDGVDIDYEDMQAMNTNKAEAWLITFQRELRRLLPAGQYVITHAPVAPWFTSAPDYKSGAYVAIHQQVGDGIDWYNIQFYNQGDGVYGDCNSLVFDSGNNWPSTSVFEINSYAGVPLNKIVIGKPLDAGKASNGYVTPSTLNTCVKQAKAHGWNAGVMFWEWTSAAPGIIATVRG